MNERKRDERRRAMNEIRERLRRELRREPRLDEVLAARAKEDPEMQRRLRARRPPLCRAALVAPPRCRLPEVTMRIALSCAILAAGAGLLAAAVAHGGDTASSIRNGGTFSIVLPRGFNSGALDPAGLDPVPVAALERLAT